MVKTKSIKPISLVANRFLQKSSKMVHSTTVYPHWLKNGNRFCINIKQLKVLSTIWLMLIKRTRKELFDNDKMASWLTEITKDPYDGKYLPKFDLSL